MVRMSALALVISCNASSNDQPSACKLAISLQLAVGLDAPGRPHWRSSWVLTVRSPVSVPRDGVQISRTFLSKALSVARCAPVQSAMAFLKICWVGASHAGLRCALSMLISGVSSKSALLTSRAPVRASTMSWYCFCDMRSWQGTHLMLPLLNTRMLGIAFASNLNALCVRCTAPTSRRGGACSAHTLEAEVEGRAEGPDGKEAPPLCLVACLHMSKARRSRATAGL